MSTTTTTTMTKHELERCRTDLLRERQALRAENRRLRQEAHNRTWSALSVHACETIGMVLALPLALLYLAVVAICEIGTPPDQRPNAKGGQPTHG